MDPATQEFERLRPRLRGIAYRMLASMDEADELVQDVWLRWHEADPAALDSAEAWLVTVTSRLAIDRLRSAKARRELYSGFWLPEPWLDEALPPSQQHQTPPATPEQLLEQADDISVAFLMLLERLSPEARAAFLLREVFDTDYPDVARMLGKTEAACRQMVSRAKAQIREGRPRQQVTPDTHLRLLSRFARAASSGGFDEMRLLLADDAELISDGGGVVSSFGKALLGARRIAQLYFAVWRRGERAGRPPRIELARINGQWGLLRFVDGTLESAQSLDSDGQRITRIHTQRNPHKLRALEQAWLQSQSRVTKDAVDPS